LFLKCFPGPYRSNEKQVPTAEGVKGMHKMGCCPVPRRDSL
jgi:hypothetical protein